MNVTGVNVGETREHQLNSLYRGYGIEAVYLKGAERDGIEEGDRLPIDTIDNT
jgi:hypothetical protein